MAGTAALTVGMIVATLFGLGGLAMVAIGIYYMIEDPFTTGLILLLIGLFLVCVAVALNAALSHRRSNLSVVVVHAPAAQPAAGPSGQPVVLNNAV
jgi:uncharacterized membrane protein YtjA (UPF0391 family)